MGDTARFRVFAEFIESTWPDRSLRIADVAAGKGGLHAELWRRGYRDVTCFDRRPRKAKRPHFRYRLFTANESEPFDLVVGMHSDGGTDEAMEYALRRELPFAVVPCCRRPSAWTYHGPNEYLAWVDHLAAHAPAATVTTLSMNGANLCIASTARSVMGTPD